MPFSLTAIVLLAVYCVASIAYVYRWRGRARYASASQFLRKSWPVFAPFNCVLYMATRAHARRPVLDAGYLHGIQALRTHWRVIREEALALVHAGELDATAVPGSAGYHDLGFRTFYKRGWRKFYLRWYGAPHRSAQRLCPRTVRLLDEVPGIRAAMFSLLPPHSELTLHADPLACSLRYHIGLETPNSDRCFISVDGRRMAWHDGRDFVFDETYPHYVRNETDAMRLILMCDVERPMHPLGRAFNRGYALVARALAVPNTHEDRRGPLNALFAALSPWRARALALKDRRRALYQALKFGFNAGLVLAAFGALYGMLTLMEHAGAQVLS